MAATSVSLQAACGQGADPLLQTWAPDDLGDLPPLPMQPGSHDKRHSPMEGSITDFDDAGMDQDYLQRLMDEMMTDGKQMDLQICNGMAFAEADVVLHSPNLEEQGIALHMPSSDTLTHDSHVRGLSTPHGMLNIQHRALPPINIQRPMKPLMHEVELEGHPGQPGRFEAQPRVRPQTAMPAIHAAASTHPVHMQALPGRPQDIPRTRSWPTTGGAALLPMRYGPGVSPHEAQSHQLTAAHICRSTLLDDQEFRHRQAIMEDDPGSPPKRKGKGGRQRAPAPDASVDPKRARRIMANRASAAKSKEKQKRKVEMLDQQARDCEDQVRALQVCNRRRELKCRDLADAFRKLEDDWRSLMHERSEQQAKRHKMEDVRDWLAKATNGNPGVHPNHGQQAHCPPQHGHSDAFVNVHAFSTHSMPGAPLPFEDALVGGPLTPDLQPLQAPAGSLPSMQLSESYGQALEGSTSPPELHNGSGHSTH